MLIYFWSVKQKQMLNTKKIMKKVTILLAMAVLGMNLSFASNPESKPASQVSLEIKELLKAPKLNFKENQEATALVMFTLNNNNEIVVVDVDSKVDQIESFVKARLNYKKLKTKTLLKGKIYKMPLTILNS